MVEIKGELVWFITGEHISRSRDGCVPMNVIYLAFPRVGTSSGFGRELVLAALNRGDCVIATARSLGKIQDFPETDKLCVLELDVTEGFPSIQAKFNRALGFFGRIDVLVNNAGMGYKAILEEAGYARFPFYCTLDAAYRDLACNTQLRPPPEAVRRQLFRTS